jgi:5'-methylthioadenosine phosphorylase
MSDHPTLAIIGGSGLYDMSDLENTQQLELDTPFGKPSAPILTGNLFGHHVAFLARHGIGHTLSPGEINYRANIYALKSLGIDQIVSVSAVGSLREDFAPGDLVIPDGLFDHTKSRKRSFFENGMVAHISSADPFCPSLSTQLYNAVRETGATVHLGGSFITIEGPRFSTKTESNIYQSWGLSIIGMTTSPEAFLAREAEMCYAVMAHVTDYDVWHVSEMPVTVEMVIAVLNKNTDIAQKAIYNLVNDLGTERECECNQALASALITNQEMIPKDTLQKLELLVRKYV